MDDNQLIIPHRDLSPEALSGVIQEFVTRDGTDSGYTRGSLEENMAMVRRQLDSGRAVIVFDNQTQSCNIVPAVGGKPERQFKERS